MSNPHESGGSGPQLLADDKLKSLCNELIEECEKSVEGSQLPKRLTEELESLPLDARRAIVKKVKNGCASLFIACKRGCVEIVQYLVTVCDADIEQRCYYEQEVPENRSFHLVTPLWCAAVSGKLSVVEYLVGFGCDVNAQSDSGSTPVRSACFMTHIEIVQFLVENGADISLPNVNGGTCLINSVQSVDLCRYLISKGVDVNEIDRSNKTALHYAIQENRLETMLLLLDHGADPFVIVRPRRRRSHFRDDAGRLRYRQLIWL